MKNHLLELLLKYMCQSYWHHWETLKINPNKLHIHAHLKKWDCINYKWLARWITSYPDFRDWYLRDRCKGLGTDWGSRCLPCGPDQTKPLHNRSLNNLVTQNRSKASVCSGEFMTSFVSHFRPCIFQMSSHVDIHYVLCNTTLFRFLILSCWQVYAVEVKWF